MSKMVVHDALGRQVAVGVPPRRIVSLVPSHTETLFALGAGPRVAGVTRYCIAPAEAVAAVPRIGGTKKVKLDAVRALDPDLVVANQEENDRKQVEALIAEGWPVVVTRPRTVAEGIESIEFLGRVTGTEVRAAELATDLRRRLAGLGPPPPPRRVFVAIWRDPWMSANRETFLSDLLAVAGGANVCAGLEGRYPVVEPDAIRRLDPEVVLLPDEPYVFGEADARELRETVLPHLAPDRFRLVDGQLLTWYGPRIADGVETFRRVLGD